MKRQFKVSCNECPAKCDSIFSQLEEKSIESVALNKVMNTYKKGDNVFIQGTLSHGLFCVANGKIKISMTGVDGQETILRIAGAGDIIGHRSLFGKEHYNATATVMEEASICFLDKNFILKQLGQEPSMALNLINKINQETGIAEARAASLSQRSSRERLAEVLVNLRESYGVVDVAGRTKLDIRLSREEIASITGTAHETVIRLMTEFKQDGLIEENEKVIYIKDEKKLFTLANLQA